MCIQGDLKIEMAKGELQRSPSFLMVFIAFIVYRSPFHVNAMPNLSNGFSSSYCFFCALSSLNSELTVVLSFLSLKAQACL